ncbi:MAG: heat-inducible transcriptional repressor HrcA [Syntrophomonadaceae bacterium]|jgi:heat-inducible transcriptional repressor
MTLDERKKLLLESIIRDYVETAEPVGSRAVVRKHALKISAATVRNEMADLEEMGYLEQLHTSSGRIPSEKGFRYYVDCMMHKETLSDEEIELLNKIVLDNIQEWNEVVQAIAQFLANITNYASFVIVPSVKLSQFQNLQVVPVSDNQGLVLVITDVGIILHRKINIPSSLKARDLQLIGETFTRVLGGKKLVEMTRSELQAIRDSLKNRRKIINQVLEVIDNLLAGYGEEKAVISGALNILNEPEFKDLDKLKRILAVLAEERHLKEIIPDNIGENVDIRIGSENLSEEIREMSLVFAGYRISGDMGKIGLLGPVRMEYWKAAGTVESVRDIIEKLINERFK